MVSWRQIVSFTFNQRPRIYSQIWQFYTCLNDSFPETYMNIAYCLQRYRNFRMNWTVDNIEPVSILAWEPGAVKVPNDTCRMAMGKWFTPCHVLNIFWFHNTPRYSENYGASCSLLQNNHKLLVTQVVQHETKLLSNIYRWDYGVMLFVFLYIKPYNMINVPRLRGALIMQYFCNKNRPTWACCRIGCDTNRHSDNWNRTEFTCQNPI